MAAKAIDIKKLIVASDKPKILKLTSLQLGKKLFKLCNNSNLLIVFKLSFVQPENSGKIAFSIPMWYPDINRLLTNDIINKQIHILLFGKKNPKKQIIIEIMYGILWYIHNLHTGTDKIYSIYKADRIEKILTNIIIG